MIICVSALTTLTTVRDCSQMENTLTGMQMNQAYTKMNALFFIINAPTSTNVVKVYCLYEHRYEIHTYNCTTYIYTAFLI